MQEWETTPEVSDVPGWAAWELPNHSHTERPNFSKKQMTSMGHGVNGLDTIAHLSSEIPKTLLNKESCIK